MMADDLRVLEAGAAAIIPAGGLAEKLAAGRPLRVKLGLDPTAPAVTLGWAVVLRKLRQFQDLGHTAVLIVGDVTARVGDPSGRSETRPRLTKEEVDAYSEAVLAQFAKVLDMDRVELRRNSEWLEALDIDGVLRLAAATTVARMLERDDFAARYADGRPISLMEFMYPLLQGYDSVAVEADVELGGSDQLFNLLVGRDLQRDRGQDPQVLLTVPLLEGTDGVQKMSQSLGNYVALDDPPDEMFGKLMRIPDGLIAKYLRLCTNVPVEEIDAIERGLADGSLHPNDQKRRMAREVVDLYHGPGSGEAAEDRFEHVHRGREIPADVPELRLADLGVSSDEPIWIARLLVACSLASSNAEARRLLAQGGVKLDGKQLLGEEKLTIEELDSKVLQVGRRRFVRLRA